MRTIKRENYLKRLINVMNTPDIKVITGIRRSGKSMLLKQHAEYIKRHDPAANVIMINLQDLDHEDLLEYHALNDYVLSHYVKGKHNYLYIDEVQLCEGFERTINSLHSKQIFDIYVTGSNAFLLSSDLATLFTGRVYTIEVYPFSYAEYLQYFNLYDPETSFEDYAAAGGFPGSYVYKTEQERYDYIDRDVYQTIVTRDLVTKYKIRNKELLESLTAYMLDNGSNLINSNSVTNYLNNKHVKVTVKTISRYMDYLCNAFVFYKASRYDLKGKRCLKTDNKYYLSDPSIKFAELGNKELNYGRVYENIVYLELLRRGYSVYIGKLYQKEIDFIAEKWDEKLYIQVSSYMEDEKVIQRETEPLLAIKDAYPKMIIARTHHPIYSRNGINIVDIADWLTSK